MSSEETCILQVWNETNQEWVDYGRGTVEQVRREVEASTYGHSRGVDWIDATLVVPPPT